MRRLHSPAQVGRSFPRARSTGGTAKTGMSSNSPAGSCNTHTVSPRSQLEQPFTMLGGPLALIWAPLFYIFFAALSLSQFKVRLPRLMVSSFKTPLAACAGMHSTTLARRSRSGCRLPPAACQLPPLPLRRMLHWCPTCVRRGSPSSGTLHTSQGSSGPSVNAVHHECW